MFFWISTVLGILLLLFAKLWFSEKAEVKRLKDENNLMKEELKEAAEIIRKRQELENEIDKVTNGGVSDSINAWLRKHPEESSS